MIELTLGQWLEVLDLAWEKARQVPWYERQPYYSLIACVALYERVCLGTNRGEDSAQPDYDAVLSQRVKLDVAGLNLGLEEVRAYDRTE